MRTWDDLPGKWAQHVTERQRQVVNALRKEGFVFGIVWPDLNYEAMDRIIFEMKKPIDDEHYARVYVDKEALVNGEEFEDFRSSGLCGDVVSTDRSPPPVFPDAPADYELTPADSDYVRKSKRPQEALACMRFAAAVNGGPPWWVTGYLREDVVSDGDNCYTEWGRDAAIKCIEREVGWKLSDCGGNRMCAEIGELHDSRRPCVAVQWFERVGWGLALPERRRVFRFAVDGAGMIREIYCFASTQNLGCCDLTGRRPALKDELPYERSRP